MAWQVYGGTVVGVEPVLVTVETDLGPGLQAFQLVGLPDGAVREARVRVRAAMESCGFDWPTMRLSLNLAPADLRKDGTGFDLPIGLAILAATGRFEGEALDRLGRTLAVGELGLDGSVRPVRGVLPLAIGARDGGLDAILVAEENGREAELVQSVQVIPCRDLAEAVHWIETGEARAVSGEALGGSARAYPMDLSEVRGQEKARRALEVAAAGGHNVLFVGPPGSGKTMLSKRLLTVLPALSFEEALEVTRVYSVAGLLQGGGLIERRPFRAPHHTISEVGLVGGGSGMPRPGEVSLSHHGILFLDELPEFRRSVLEVMRQPLEDGHVSVTRSLVTVRYPARVMLVASMNPCPCGYLSDPNRRCSDTPQQVAQYRSRLSGPLLDRIDLHIEVPSVPYRELRGLGAAESSADVAERVLAARQRQRARLEGTGLPNNAAMGPRELEEHCRTDEAGHRLLAMVVDRLGMSARAWGRILKVARTIADLADEADITSGHLSEAVGYRGLDRPV